MLPSSDRPQGAAAELPSAPGNVARHARADRPHILVADDEPHIGRIIKMKLEQGPFRVTLAFDGQEALDVLAREPDVALVLLDLMMPRVSGLDVLAAMRAHPLWRDVPCVVLTAAGQEKHHQQALAMGANEFLTKPFSPKKLYARAAELVGVGSEERGAGDR